MFTNESEKPGKLIACLTILVVLSAISFSITVFNVLRAWHSNLAVSQFTNQLKWTDGKWTSFGTNGPTLDMITGDAPSHFTSKLLNRTSDWWPVETNQDYLSAVIHGMSDEYMKGFWAGYDAGKNRLTNGFSVDDGRIQYIRGRADGIDWVTTNAQAILGNMNPPKILAGPTNSPVPPTVHEPVRVLRADQKTLEWVEITATNKDGSIVGRYGVNGWQWADGIVLGVVTNQVEFLGWFPESYAPTHRTNRVIRFTLPTGEMKEVAF